LIVSEAVMMALGPLLGHQRAHDVIYEVCRQAIATGRPFLDLLAENRVISAHMNRAQLAPLVEPANYLGLCGVMVDRVLAGTQEARRS
jgi:3-carboxy-cis,cis-muconate cycloisomerase